MENLVGGRTRLLPAAGTNSVISNKRAVLAQVANDPTDEHFPLLILGTRRSTEILFYPLVSNRWGAWNKWQAWHFEFKMRRNYYVIRASSLGNNLRFYKFVDGIRSQPHWAGTSYPNRSVARAVRGLPGKHHSLQTQRQKKPYRHHRLLFTTGRIGLWTKSDSISHFTDTRIRYTPAKSRTGAGA